MSAILNRPSPMEETEDIDVGVAYGRATGEHDKTLTEVGPGTPMGELLRRYWQPVAVSSDATDTPRRVRALGEDLILFRDKKGRPGLLHDRCAHRGTTLYYGKVEEEGIRCCYHGWMFDVKGRCVDQPCEPEGGLHRHKVRQPWYPVQERYGLVFAYMGPPDKKPALPRYAQLENLAPDREVVTDVKAYAAGGPLIAPCNWLQYFENALDQFHVTVLHSNFSGLQFTPDMAIMPQVEWSHTDRGVQAIQTRITDEGKRFLRVTEVLMPNARGVSNPFKSDGGPIDRVEITLPVDDTHFTTFTAGHVPIGKALRGDITILHNGKRWNDMTEEDHQQYPDDYEAQIGQGPITLHSEEHLGTTDRGIVMYRRLLFKQIDAIRQGRDPLGISFDTDAPPIQMVAGSYIQE